MDANTFGFTVGSYACLAIKGAEGFDCNVLLVTTDQHRVLVDTGPHGATPLAPLPLPERLRAAGVAPADIDVVLLTHADFDHIGGAVDAHGDLTFPRARYLLLRAEWDFWATKPERLRPDPAMSEGFRRTGLEVSAQRLARLRDTLELVDAGTEVVPGIRVLAAPGHTPGCGVVAVTSDGAQLLFIADLVYNPADIVDPDWYSIYDFDPVQVVATRRRILCQAAADGTLLMATHAPFPGLGRVAQDGPGWRWHPFNMPD
jgi:glyoxylase-like metal-dependent hydrolase (beta-lactamase superfamily II)